MNAKAYSEKNVTANIARDLPTNAEVVDKMWEIHDVVDHRRVTKSQALQQLIDFYKPNYSSSHLVEILRWYVYNSASSAWFGQDK